MFPASCTASVPRERPAPKSRYAAAPCARIQGTVASVTTLLMTVGRPNSPAIAGSGGLARTMPRLPSIESSIAVSSPHTYEPAPMRTSRLKRRPLPPTSSPSQPAAVAAAIAASSARTACGYSLRT